MFVICFTKNKLLGGLGDRVIGIISIKLISKSLNQPFYILWNKENIKSYIDYSKYDYQLQNIKEIDVKQYNCIDNQKKLKKYLMNSENIFNNNINKFYLNQEISQYLYKNKLYNNKDYFNDILFEYRNLYEDILLPKEYILTKVNKLINNFKNIVGIQLRCGDKFMKTNTNETHYTGIDKDIKLYLNSIQKICNKKYDNYAIFLTTDNINIYEIIVDFFSSKKVIYNFDLIQHMDRKNIDKDFSKVFVDNYILSQKTDIMFITKYSNFGRIAALSSIHNNIYNIDGIKLDKRKLLTKHDSVFIPMNI